MILLALSDIHGRLGNLEKIISLIHNKGVGLVLVAGDFTNYGTKEQTKEALGMLKGLKVMAVPGNLDAEEVLKALEEEKVSLHAKRECFGNLCFAGFGGGLEGNPGALLSSEEAIKEGLLRNCRCKNKLVLLTHLPPFGTRLDNAGGKHIGSRAVKAVVEKIGPMLLLCGHAHESFGEQKIGKTQCINIGAVKDGKAVLVKIGKSEFEWERIQV